MISIFGKDAQNIGVETTQEAREAALLNNQTTMAPTTTMMMTTSNPDFGLDMLSQNDSFNKSLDIDLSVLNDIGVNLFVHILNNKRKVFCPKFSQSDSCGPLPSSEHKGALNSLDS